MAPSGSQSHAFGTWGSNWVKEWKLIGYNLAANISTEGALSTDYYEVLVLGECYTCTESQAELKEAPALDLRNLRSIHDKERRLKDNFCRLPLRCSCANEDGGPRRPVGIRAIIVKCKHPGVFDLECRAQCHNCDRKCESLPTLKADWLEQYQQLLTVQCCSEPKVKVTALKMHFTPNFLAKIVSRVQHVEDIPPPPPPKTCGVCCEPVVDGMVACQTCPMVYHAKCQQEWLSRRRHLMAPKCLYCFNPLAHDAGLNSMLNVDDVYIHANSNDRDSLDRLFAMLPGVQDHIVRLPKNDPKTHAAPSLGRPTLYLAWYRFKTAEARDAAFAHAELHGLRNRLGLRKLDKGDNKLRSHRKFGEVHGW